MPGEQKFCEVCKRTMNINQFYKSNNREKYPDGTVNRCKKCLTMHVDNWVPDSYLWILQEVDVPYVPDEWNKLLRDYGKDPSKMTGLTIIGRYLAKMQLKQYRDYRWADTEHLQQIEDLKKEQAMKRQGYSASEIALELERSKLDLSQDGYAIPTINMDEIFPQGPAVSAPEQPVDDYFARMAGEPDDFQVDLTEEDRTYLRLKWGKAYKPEEWVKLEQLYEEMMSSYDIQSAGHIDTLKLLCKTSLKANQLIDMGDIEGFQKMEKAYNSLMKSGNFTAQQNKGENGDFVDSVGELIEMCEKQGYIERYYIDQPNDQVDFTIRDMQRYTRTLVQEEPNLTNLIELALKQIEREDEEAANSTETEIVDEMNMSLDELEKEITDQDYEDFEDFLEGEASADSSWLDDN